MLEIAFSWPVVYAFSGLLIGSGVAVLSMTPPETKIAVYLFSVGFPLLLVKLCAWAAFERTDSFTQKAVFIGLVCAASGVLWYACVALANSKIPHNGPKVLDFKSMLVNVTNMPETKSIAHSVADKGWDDARYSDVRLAIDNRSGGRVENIDLTISTLTKGDHDKGSLISAIDQLSSIPGVEFPPPKAPELVVRFKTEDGSGVNLPINPGRGAGDWLVPVPEVKLFAPKLLRGENMRLILGIVPADGSGRVAPESLLIIGTYDVVSGANMQRTTVSQIVKVKQ
jgi:hypothetical protein